MIRLTVYSPLQFRVIEANYNARMSGALPPVVSAEQIAPQADLGTAENEDDALVDTVRYLSCIQSDCTLFLTSLCVYNGLNQGAGAIPFHYSPPPSVVDDEQPPSSRPPPESSTDEACNTVIFL